MQRQPNGEDRRFRLTSEVVSDGDDLTRTLLARMQTLGHIRLARGLVGKASVIAGIALLALGSIAWRADVALLPVMAGAVLLAFFAYLAAVLWFAHRHPEQALLEEPKSCNIGSRIWRREVYRRRRCRRRYLLVGCRLSYRRSDGAQGLLCWCEVGDHDARADRPGRESLGSIG